MELTPEQEAMFEKMTPFQRRFVSNVIAGMTQKDAYIAAGCKTTNDGSIRVGATETMRLDYVRDFILSMQTEVLMEAVMSRQEAMEILSMIGRGNLTDIVKFKTVNIGKDMETGNDVHQTAWTIIEGLQETDPDALMIISELEVGKHGPKIKQHSKTAAIQQLAKMQGWEAAQKFDHSSTDGSMSPKGKCLDDFYGAPHVPTES